MLEITIPGGEKLILEHLLLDYNGTVAHDGKLLMGVPALLLQLARLLTIHVITADTFGSVTEQLQAIPCQIHVIDHSRQDERKEAYVQKLGAARTVSIGNGRNDYRMLKVSALGIAVIQGEGAAVKALLSADVVCHSIRSALELLLQPLRLQATLRT